MKHPIRSLRAPRQPLKGVAARSPANRPFNPGAVAYRRGRPIAAYVYLPRETGDRVATTERIDEAVMVDRTADGEVAGEF